ncbi:MAG: hypothetical protein U0Z53_08400 [Blastocatellia bacterium]
MRIYQESEILNEDHHQPYLPLSFRQTEIISAKDFARLISAIQLPGAVVALKRLSPATNQLPDQQPVRCRRPNALSACCLSGRKARTAEADSTAEVEVCAAKAVG